jgi:Spy/CpxP family protein refolding chaperone
MTRFHSLVFGTMLVFGLHVPAQQSTSTPNPATDSAPDSADKSGQGQPSMQDDVPTVDEQLKVLTIKLDLTDDQQAKMRPILQEMHDATAKISQDHSLSREERLAKVRPLRYKAHEQLREILSDEQVKKLQQYLQGPHPEMHGSLSGAASSPQPPHD